MTKQKRTMAAALEQLEDEGMRLPAHSRARMAERSFASLDENVREQLGFSRGIPAALNFLSLGGPGLDCSKRLL